MCVEYISIGLCAPGKAPSLSFTCGQLHLVAERREVCDKAKGSCVCFFATCGNITQQANAAPIDWANIPKLRCLPCTKREDHVGAPRNNQDLLESPLLTRNAVLPSEQNSYVEAIRGLWQGRDHCPFHQNTPPVMADIDLSKVKEDQVGSPLWVDGKAPSFPPSSKSSSSSPEDPFKPKRGLAASQWANAPPFTPPQEFAPRARRPIPIVRPPSSNSLSREKSPDAVSVKSIEKVKVASLDDGLHAELKAKWMPPHLRRRNDELSVAAPVSVTTTA